MKNFCITLLVLSIITLTVLGVETSFNVKNQEYLRIHVRANSNQPCDQEIKYAVKDAVVEFLVPYVSECETKKEAEQVVKNLLPKLEQVADSVLKNGGFNYTSKAKVKGEEFPTRTYGALTLEQGYYDALIMYLGEGSGENWWCVVYPPLCFTGDRIDVKYQSKIYRIIKDFMLNKEEK